MVVNPTKNFMEISVFVKRDMEKIRMGFALIVQLYLEDF